MGDIISQNLHEFSQRSGMGNYCKIVQIAEDQYQNNYCLSENVLYMRGAEAKEGV